MIKHVGKHSNKKCVILFRTVPNEGHMCLVIYPDTLPRHIHDDIMTALESESGQQAKEFSDYLFRFTLSDGNNALETLHKEGMIKKVPTNQVIVTPNAKSTVRLDELNNILDKLAQGEEAIKELADLDSSAGMTGKRRRTNEGREPGELRAPRESRSTPAQVTDSVNIKDVLSDEDLAKSRLAQAQRMQNEAKALLAEAARLQEEALKLNGPAVKNGTTKSKKAAKAKEA
jgi:hypothetical protein